MYGRRTTPFFEVLRHLGGRRSRRRIIVSSRTRFGPAAKGAVNWLRVAYGWSLAAAVAILLGALAAWRERQRRLAQRALENTPLSSIAEAKRVLRGRITDPLTGSSTDRHWERHQRAQQQQAEGAAAAAAATSVPSAPPPSEVYGEPGDGERKPPPPQEQESSVTGAVPVPARDFNWPFQQQQGPPRAAADEGGQASLTPPMFNPEWGGGIVDRVYAHLCGHLWVPSTDLVRAAFTVCTRCLHCNDALSRS